VNGQDANGPCRKPYAHAKTPCDDGATCTTLGHCRYRNGPADDEPPAAARVTLAAHAPPVADWFEPFMRSPKPEIPNRHAELTREQRERLDAVDEGVDLELDAATLEFRARLNAAAAAQRAWEHERKVRRLAQWPWYYADAVLAEWTP
jgi:hypothetical protein